ncbi:MAG: CRISPR-associated endonuclease Cas2 [Ignavibacteria bacterium]|nr:CRISPR-associated endonuclease Cas2 [Ignavibacteria bacterium]
MYIIIVYDAAPKRGVKLLKFLRQHLLWVQNSVFEGEVTEAEFEVVKAGIKERINKEKDSILYYQFDSQNYTTRGVIGVERNETDSFI